YIDFVKAAAVLEFGNSCRTSLPVTHELWPKFKRTFHLARYSRTFSLFLCLIARLSSSVRQYTYSANGPMLVALFGLSMPNFWLGLMLMQWFSINLGWLPPTGWGTPEQVIMPVITLGTMGAAVIARMTRSSMLDVLTQDYIRTARA